MNLINKRLPTSYPLLASYRDDYSIGSYSVESYELKKHNDQTIISVKAKLNCPEMEQLIKDGYAKYFLRVECPRTMHIQTELSPDSNIAIELDNSNFERKADIFSGIMTVKSVEQYSSSLLSPFESGEIFQFATGTILAAAPASEVRILDAQKISAFRFVKNTDPKLKLFFEVKTDTDAVEIHVDEDLYFNLQSYRKVPKKENLLFHSFYLSAVQTALYDLLKHPDEATSYKWCDCLNTAMEEHKDAIKNKTGVDIEEIKKPNSSNLLSKISKVAQFLLDHPPSDCYESVDVQRPRS